MNFGGELLRSVARISISFLTVAISITFGRTSHPPRFETRERGAYLETNSR
jgi:hypothetical protein